MRHLRLLTIVLAVVLLCPTVSLAGTVEAGGGGFGSDAGGEVQSLTLASGVTTNTTTTPVPGVTGSKTIWLELSGTGAVSVDITVYGARVSAPTSSELEVVCTYAGLSGTTKKIGTCNGVMTAAYPYLAIKTENISGTGASVTAYVFY